MNVMVDLMVDLMVDVTLDVRLDLMLDFPSPPHLPHLKRDTITFMHT